LGRNGPFPLVGSGSWFPFASVVSDNTPRTVTRLIRGRSKDFSVVRTVTSLNTGNKEVGIDVRWTRVENGQTNTYNHQARTIVRTR